MISLTKAANGLNVIALNSYVLSISVGQQKLLGSYVDKTVRSASSVDTCML